MSNLATLQQQVGEWSKANFGDQESKFFTYPTPLGHLAPLLGITEEFGELEQAIKKDCYDEQKDAIGDLMIYSVDFAKRLSLDLSDYEVAPATATDLGLEIGMLNHHVLKMHQGIRAYAETSFALTEIKETLYSIYDILHELCNVIGTEPPFDIATETFLETVSKRNWVDNPETGTPSSKLPQ